RVEYLYRHKSKTDRSEIQLVDGRILDRYSSPLYVDKKVYVGRVWFFQDVTEQKQHAEKIAQVERTKQEFVSIAAHQLRSPVTSLMTASRLLSDYEASNLSESQREFLSMVVKESEKMHELVDFLLKMTRAEAGNLTLAPTPVKLKQLTHEIV